MKSANRPSKWLHTGVILAVLWAALILGLTVKTMLLRPSFEAAAAEPCPQLLLPLALAVEHWLQRIDGRFFVKVIVWRDAKSRTELSPYRRGELSLSCAQLEQRAQLFLLGAKSSVITPRAYLRKGVLGLLILVPAFALFAFAYFLHVLSSRWHPAPQLATSGRRAT